VQVPDLRSPREIRLVHRKDDALSHAARAFVAVAKENS